ncbi:MAG: pilin [Patescibacteria group bacterium]
MINKKFSLRKFIIVSFFIAQVIFSSLILSFPLSPALAADDAMTPLDFTPQIWVPGSDFKAGVPIKAGTYDDKAGVMSSDLLAKYIIAFYSYGLAASGILATIILMGAGVIWLTSGGDSGKITQAKELISGTIAGIIILVCAWIILNTINPRLVKLNNLDMQIVAKGDKLVCCDPVKGETIIPVKIVNGKNIAIDGSLKGKAITCGNKVPSCPNSEKCFLGGDNKYSCVIDNWSCFCKIPGYLLIDSYYCKDNLSQESCYSWCKETGNFITGYSASTYPAATYQCYGDSNVYPKPGATCGNKAGATCRLKNKFSCPDGSFHDASLNTWDCAPGYLCCY